MICCRDSESHYLPLNNVFIKPTFNLAGFCLQILSSPQWAAAETSGQFFQPSLGANACVVYESAKGLSSLYTKFGALHLCFCSFQVFSPSFLAATLVTNRPLFLQPSKAMSFLLEFQLPISHIALKLGPFLRMKLHEKRKKWKAYPSPHPAAFVYFHSPQVVFPPCVFVRVFSCNQWERGRMY